MLYVKNINDISIAYNDYYSNSYMYARNTIHILTINPSWNS